MDKFQQEYNGPVNVKFAVPCFRYEGVEYSAEEVEQAAAQGNEKAIEIMANLVKIKSGIVIVTPAEQKPARKKQKPAEE